MCRLQRNKIEDILTGRWRKLEVYDLNHKSKSP